MVNIRIENVVKVFGETRAVDRVSLDIARGELFFLLGPSGCGKTTLLRMIAGFYQPDEGRILFDDRDVSLLPAHQRSTGMVFQNYALWPHMNVRQNLAFGLEMHKVAPVERQTRVERALDMVQMHEYADRSPNQLSGGQQQRVALARALVLEPDVVLMDEPLSNLDAKLRLEMREQIKRIHENLNLTMIYVTHDQNEALSMADRMAIMHRGVLRQLGTPREIYNRPADRFVADFIGESNFLQGKITQIGNPTVITTNVGELASAVIYEGASEGDPVVCSIRPERVHLSATGEFLPNRLRGEVLRATYLGDHEQYFIRLSDGTEVKSVAFSTHTRRVDPGQAVQLGFHPDDVVVLRREG